MPRSGNTTSSQSSAKRNRWVARVAERISEGAGIGPEDVDVLHQPRRQGIESEPTCRIGASEKAAFSAAPWST
jgi:hypothetical protein